MSEFLKDRFSTYEEVDSMKKAGLYPFFRGFESEQGTVVTVQGQKLLMFGSNSYLGLTTHPKIKEIANQALKKYGTSFSGSRFLNGTADIHLELEERLAKFLKKEAATIFSTGFHVNVGAIPCVTGKDDVILMDRLDHASIYEGARLSMAKTVKFEHNDMDSLERKLKQFQHCSLRLIVVDGIFSMEGNIANLPGIVALAEKYNAAVMTDCAHAIGVLGDHGAGTASHFGLTDKVELIGGTFSKSLASTGGFIAGDKDTINFLKHHSRSLIFSASMTPASTAATIAALDIIEQDDSLRLKLWENTHHAMARLQDLGFDTGDSETPIIPIYIRDNYKTYAFTLRLMEEGIFVNPVVAPAVAPENSLIRFSLMATHSIDQIDQAIDKMWKVAKELRIHLLHKAA